MSDPVHVTAVVLLLALAGTGLARAQAPEGGAKTPDQILLKDYKPVSIHKVPVTTVPKARYPAIDMHSHPWAKTPEDVDRWVKTMDEVGIEKTVLLTGAHGAEFDRLVELCEGTALRRRAARAPARPLRRARHFRQRPRG